MSFIDLIRPNDAGNDLPAPPAIDIMAAAADTESATHDRSAEDELFEALMDSAPPARDVLSDMLRKPRLRTPRQTDKLYARIEREKGYIPHEVDHPAKADDLRESFARLLEPVPDEEPAAPDQSEGPSTAMRGLFERGDPVFPITRMTYGPLQRAVRPGFTSLSRHGWNQPVTDPYGDLMRNALRRLVRVS